MGAAGVAMLVVDSSQTVRARSLSFWRQASATRTPTCGVRPTVNFALVQSMLQSEDRTSVSTAGKFATRLTRRRINPGLVVGALGILVMVVWVGTALTISTTASRSAKDTAADSLKIVTHVQITAQQARADETLSLIRRGDEEIPCTKIICLFCWPALC